MSRIRLKPQSAEYADDDSDHTPPTRGCDMPGCRAEGVHKAPRDRSLQNHFWFCFDHVQEYNRAWDYFSGMSQKDIEDHIVRSALWDRPTRRYDGLAAMGDKIRRAAWKTYHFTDEEPPEPQPRTRTAGIDHGSPEFQALALMGLEPPLTLKIIKARYKELVKKHHPDVNQGSPESEELLKRINMAYTILKMSFEKFERLTGDE